MINHIDVSHVLRRCVCDLYSNLVTRPTGVAVRTEIEQLIEAAPGERTLTVIDFTNVGLLDFSCADEIVAKLLLRQPAGGEGYFVFRGVSESHLDAIEAVLERHGLALVAEHAGDGRAHLVGVVDDGERSAWELASRGVLEPAALGAAIGCDPGEAERLLDALHRRRLVMRLDGGYVVPGTLP